MMKSLPRRRRGSKVKKSKGIGFRQAGIRLKIDLADSFSLLNKLIIFGRLILLVNLNEPDKSRYTNLKYRVRSGHGTIPKKAMTAFTPVKASLFGLLIVIIGMREEAR